MAEAVKRFGGRERPKAHKFELATIGGDGKNIHTFQVVPLLQAGDVVALMDALDLEPEKAANPLSRLLTKVMDDTDGVSTRWKLKPDGDQFLGPDNEPHPLEDEKLFTDPAAGSSRRRWDALMDPRNDEGIELMDLVDIGQWVVTLSTDRPTPARTPSSRASRKTPR